MSLDAVDRPSRTSQPQSRTKIMYSRRRDTADHHVLRLTDGASMQLTGQAHFWHPARSRCRLATPSAPRRGRLRSARRRLNLAPLQSRQLLDQRKVFFLHLPPEFVLLEVHACGKQQGSRASSPGPALVSRPIPGCLEAVKLTDQVSQERAERAGFEIGYHRPRLPTRHQERQSHAAISPSLPALNEHRQNMRHTGGIGSCGWRRSTG